MSTKQENCDSCVLVQQIGQRHTSIQDANLDIISKQPVLSVLPERNTQQGVVMNVLLPVVVLALKPLILTQLLSVFLSHCSSGIKTSCEHKHSISST